MGRLCGKVAIVTGGAGGIGAATVERLVDDGAQVVIADVNFNAAQAVAGRIGKDCIAVKFDAEDTTSINDLVQATIYAYGRIDILHNNAALVGRDALELDLAAVALPLEFWDRTMAVNARAYFAACKFAIPHMIAVGGGSIINMSSTAALTGDLVRTAYGASKAAIISLTRDIAVQYGKQGIRCNAIAPGLIVTENAKNYPDLLKMIERHTLTPYLGEPNDIASLVSFLASGEAKFITAQTISIDGGMLSHIPHFADAV